MHDPQIKNVHTADQAETLSGEIDQLLTGLYKGANKSEEKIELKEQELIKLQDELKNLPLIHLTVPQKLDEKTTSSISKWLQNNLNQQVLIDTEINPDILGGAKISWKGKFSDQTVLKKINLITNEVF